MKTARNFFSPADKAAIVNAIREAEENTSGEIRVHIENTTKIDVLDRSAYIFDKLKLQNTALRNGVLFYLSIRDRKFAILGDKGINSAVPAGFWDDIRDLMVNHFAENRFTEGLVEGILKAGQQLKIHFPHKSDDINELTDEISFGKS
jgi:uncharacterized membrane protein